MLLMACLMDFTSRTLLATSVIPRNLKKLEIIAGAGPPSSNQSCHH